MEKKKKAPKETKAKNKVCCPLKGQKTTIKKDTVDNPFNTEKLKKHPKPPPVVLKPRTLKNICGRIILLMREGKGLREVCLELGIGKAQCGRYQTEYDEFTQAVEEGEWLAQGWWERLGRSGMLDKSINATMYQFVMRNRFGWDKDQKEQEGPPAPRIIGLPDIDLNCV